jgi:hypothetical protein
VSATGRAVAATDRVSDVLARDESLVEVFVRQGPQFAKLRNRAMRRVMARLVTVEQVARMAGVAAPALVGELNAALGIAGAPPAPAARGASREPQPKHPPGLPVVEVDVRDDLRAGREPFSKIMAAVAGLGGESVLRLRTTFEPVPLYAVLGKRGLLHEARAEAPDDWSVWFWASHLQAAGEAQAGREGPASCGAPAGRDSLCAPRADSPGSDQPDLRTVRLDVRGLEPPEPMLRTLAALEALPPDHTLVQVNARVPQFLLPILAERGYTWEIHESSADRVIVRIRRAG